jgi:hypothetical protein
LRFTLKEAPSAVKFRRSDLTCCDRPSDGRREDFFKEPYPASTAFIASLLNPDWLVEVEAVAVID